MNRQINVFIKISLLKKLFAFSMAFVFLCSHVLFAYSAEKNFWDERRNASQINKSENTVVAQLASAAMMPPSVNPISSPAFNTPFPSIIRNLNKVDVESKKVNLTQLSQLVSRLSVNGSVRSIQLPINTLKQENGPTVIYIQDVHGQLEAQKNIGAMILNVLNLNPEAIVGLEGTNGRVPIEFFKGEDKTVNKEIGSFYLNTGLITGAEYAGFAAPSDPYLFGLEDKALYLKNLDAVKRALKKQKNEKEKVKEEKRQLQLSKSKIYSSKLLALDQIWRSYHEDELNVGDYLSTLITIDSDIKSYSTLSLFLQTWEIERSLNFKRAEAERTFFLSSLTQKLDKNELNKLIERSVALKSGNLPYSDFYRQLKEGALKASVDLSKTPEFTKYLDYVLKAESVKPELFLKEVSQFEKQVFLKLIQSTEEKLLFKRAFKYHLIEKLVNLTMTAEDWNEYKPFKGENGRLDYELFYELAEARNNFLADNLINELKSTEAKVSIIVAGGFHSEGLNALLAKENITLITASPKISSIDTSDNYLSVFTQEKTPLEKLFDSPKISIVKTLSTNPIGPSPQAKVVAGLTGLLAAPIAMALSNGTAVQAGAQTITVAKSGVLLPPVFGDVVLQGLTDTGTSIVVTMHQLVTTTINDFLQSVGIYHLLIGLWWTALPLFVVGMTLSRPAKLADENEPGETSEEIGIKFPMPLHPLQRKAAEIFEKGLEHRIGELDFNKSFFLGQLLYVQYLINEYPSQTIEASKLRDTTKPRYGYLFEQYNHKKFFTPPDFWESLKKDNLEKKIKEIFPGNSRLKDSYLSLIDDFFDDENKYEPQELSRAEFLDSSFLLFGFDPQNTKAFHKNGFKTIRDIVTGKKASLTNVPPSRFKLIDDQMKLIGLRFKGMEDEELTNWANGEVAGVGEDLSQNTSDSSESLLASKLTALNLPERVVNLLEESGITLIKDLVLIPEQNLSKVPGIGRQVVKEIKSNLEGLNLKLGMNVWQIAAGARGKTEDNLLNEIERGESGLSPEELSQLRKEFLEGPLDHLGLDQKHIGKLNQIGISSIRDLILSSEYYLYFTPQIKGDHLIEMVSSIVESLEKHHLIYSLTEEEVNRWVSGDSKFNSTKFTAEKWQAKNKSTFLTAPAAFILKTYFKGPDVNILLKRPNLQTVRTLLLTNSWNNDLSGVNVKNVSKKLEPLNLTFGMTADAISEWLKPSQIESSTPKPKSLIIFLLLLTAVGMGGEWLFPGAIGLNEILISAVVGLMVNYGSQGDIHRDKPSDTWSGDIKIAVPGTWGNQTDAFDYRTAKKMAENMVHTKVVNKIWFPTPDEWKKGNLGGEPVNEETLPAILEKAEKKKLLTGGYDVFIVMLAEPDRTEIGNTVVIVPHTNKPSTRKTIFRMPKEIISYYNVIQPPAEIDPDIPVETFLLEETLSIREEENSTNFLNRALKTGKEFIGRIENVNTFMREEDSKYLITALEHYLQISIQTNASTKITFRYGFKNDLFRFHIIDNMVIKTQKQKDDLENWANTLFYEGELKEYHGDVYFNSRADIIGVDFSISIPQLIHLLPVQAATLGDFLDETTEANLSGSGRIFILIQMLRDYFPISEGLIFPLQSAIGQLFELKTTDDMGVIDTFSNKQLAEIKEKLFHMKADLELTDGEFEILNKIYSLFFQPSLENKSNSPGHLDAEDLKPFLKKFVEYYHGDSNVEIGDLFSVMLKNNNSTRFLSALHELMPHLSNETGYISISVVSTIFDKYDLNSAERAAIMKIINPEGEGPSASGFSIFLFLPMASLNIDFLSLGLLAAAFLTLPVFRGRYAKGKFTEFNEFLRLMLVASAPLLLFPLAPLMSILFFGFGMAALAYHHHQVNHPLGFDVTANADLQMAALSDEDVVSSIETLMGDLQANLLRNEFDFKGRKLRILTQRFAAQMHMAEIDFKTAEPGDDIYPEYRNAAYLAGRAGLSFIELNVSLTELMESHNAGPFTIVMTMEWLRGLFVQFILDFTTKELEPFYAKPYSANIKPNLVHGFYLDSLMDPNADKSQMENTREHFLKHVENYPLGGNSQPNVLIVRTPISGALEENKAMVKNTLINLVSNNSTASKMKGYLEHAVIVFEPAGLISPSRVLTKANQNFNFKNLDSVRFELYTAAPEQIDMNDSLVQFIVYSFMPGLRVLPISTLINSARVISIHA